MDTMGFDGSTLLLQDDLLHGLETTVRDFDEHADLRPDHLAPSIRRAFTATDDEGALLVVEVDAVEPLESGRSDALLGLVASVARRSIRKSDIVERLDERTLAIGLPGSGRIGMTRVADAIRQRVAAESLDADGAPLETTITVGAVHTTEAQLVDLDELLLAARVNLDSARAAGRNRTNWSDWHSTA